MKRLVGIVAMVMAGFGLVVFIGMMNRKPDRNHSVSAKSAQRIAMPKEAPKKVKKKRAQKRRQKKRSTRRAPAAPALASQLGSLDLALDLVDPSDLDGVDRSVLGDTSNAVLNKDTVDVLPRAIRTPFPDIPLHLRKTAAPGRVVLWMLIASSGKVERAKVLEASPPGLYDDLVLNAVKGWRFSPAKFKGEAVRFAQQQPFEFAMDG